MVEMSKPILCVDFDGVLHSYTSGWQGVGNVNDGPVPGAMVFLADAIEHFDVVIYSSRSKDPRGIGAMEHAICMWLADEGLPTGGIIRDITFAHEKPAAFLTIDDRAVCFDGVFPPISQLLEFKPWNKRNAVTT